jgi:membrane protease YdiL (CAAX protease family)
MGHWRTFGLFVSGTLAFSWGLWTLLVFELVPSSMTIPLIMLGGFGPFVGAVVTLLLTGRHIRRWLRSNLRYRIPLRWYVLALALPPVFIVSASVVYVTFFGASYAFAEVPALWLFPLGLGVTFFLGGGQEEPGWRGYLLPALQEAYSPLTAGFLVGVVWAGWHLPLVFIPGTIQNTLPLGLYLLQLVELSILLTWLTNRVEGSVLPAILLHAGGNALLNYYPVGGVAGATTPLGLGLLVMMLTIAVVALAISAGPSLGIARPAR